MTLQQILRSSGLMLLFILCFTDRSTAQKPAPQAVFDLLYQQASAWNMGDIDAYMKGYWPSDSLVFIGKNGPQYGYEKTRLNYHKSYPDAASMGQLRFEFLQTKLMNKSCAFVSGRWFLKREKGDIQGVFTLLLKKMKGQWFIVYDHSS